MNRLTVEKSVEMIMEDQIHILINLNGHTAGERNLIFAVHPAPIQVPPPSVGYHHVHCRQVVRTSPVPDCEAGQCLLLPLDPSREQAGGLRCGKFHMETSNGSGLALTGKMAVHRATYAYRV